MGNICPEEEEGEQEQTSQKFGFFSALQPALILYLVPACKTIPATFPGAHPSFPTYLEPAGA